MTSVYLLYLNLMATRMKHGVRYLHNDIYQWRNNNIHQSFFFCGRLYPMTFIGYVFATDIQSLLL